MASSEQAKQIRRTADGGCARAQVVLGEWTSAPGSGGPPEGPLTAAAWFRKAADRGLAMEKSALAACYFVGQGVEQNFALVAE